MGDFQRNRRRVNTRLAQQHREDEERGGRLAGYKGEEAGRRGGGRARLCCLGGLIGGIIQRGRMPADKI